MIFTTFGMRIQKKKYNYLLICIVLNSDNILKSLKDAVKVFSSKTILNNIHYYTRQNIIHSIKIR